MSLDSLKIFASLTDKEIELLKSVETQKGKFSEALIISDTSRGVIRLVPYPFLYWIATSDAKDNELSGEIKYTSCKENIWKRLRLGRRRSPMDYVRKFLFICFILLLSGCSTFGKKGKSF